METSQKINFFAPLPVVGLAIDPESVPKTFPSPPATQQLLSEKLFQLDPADRFTYIIMGLAVFIAFLIPLLN